MKKIEYPRKKVEFLKIKVPIPQRYKQWRCGTLEKDGSFLTNGYADHPNEESCWICCDAHNSRLGFTKAEVKQIIIQTGYEQKRKEQKEKVKKRSKPGKRDEATGKLKRFNELRQKQKEKKGKKKKNSSKSKT